MIRLVCYAFVVLPSCHAFVSPSRRAASFASSTTELYSAALIVQIKGGGHGELGYHIAKTLETKYSDKITSITILQDSACKDTAEPFKSYATDLPNVKVIKAPLGDESTSLEALSSLLGSTQYKYVWDNASKGPTGAGKAVCDLAKGWDPKLFCYVSSAGMYTPAEDGTFPMPETTPIKASAGQAQFDQYAVSLGLPLVSFRPQYIYGPKANKFDYLDWFFDRLVRNLPLPIPGDGQQKVSLTHAEDVATLLCSPLNDEAAAVEQRYFNCGTDRLWTYDMVAYNCATAAGIPIDQVKIEHYDHKLYGKATFPFRMTDFYVAPDMAKEKLGWPGPAHSLPVDLEEYYAQYVARGAHTRQLSLVKDWEIVVGSKTSLPEYVASIYDAWDPLILDTETLRQK
jgi:nucleoside-diphosphate-sugar epimerase